MTSGWNRSLSPEKEELEEESDHSEGSLLESDSQSEIFPMNELNLAAAFKSRLQHPSNWTFHRHCLKIMFDSGAALHAAGIERTLTNLQKGPAITVVNAFGDSVSAEAHGSLEVVTDSSQRLQIDDVSYDTLLFTS